ncbi:hypothetical protein IWQ60_004498 [Tieghemiomyces parasiticus]|uniref:Zinc finger PHD-type domain-containing protein n=1 Tax=Tieghemiomyces parasiticus TaxID=78921 RepID=A0A9W8DTV2_9FUNG|nr:hypothetical protein IWQ60_004498 [Tieghemiomyces parasiticus]
MDAAGPAPPQAQLARLRGLRAFAATSQFLHIFHQAFDLADFDTAQFERELLASPQSEYTRALLVKMLRVLTQNRFITDTNWTHSLVRQYERRGMPAGHLYRELPPVATAANKPVDGVLGSETPARTESPLTSLPNSPAPSAIGFPGSPTPSGSSKTTHIPLPPNTASGAATPVVAHSAMAPAGPTHTPLSTPSRLPARPRIHYFPFHEWSIVDRVYAFHHISEWFMEHPERLRLKIRHEEDCLEWRVLPIGTDSRRCTYWLFDDNRLYREHPPKPTPPATQKTPKKGTSARAHKTPTKATTPSRQSARTRRTETVQEPAVEERREDTLPEWEEHSRSEVDWEARDTELYGRWEVLCYDQKTWANCHQLIKKYRSAAERRLMERLNGEIIPQILNEYEEEERRHQMAEAAARRKRSSRIQIREAVRQSEAYGRESTTPPPPEPVRTEPRVPVKSEAERKEEEREALRRSRELRLLERQSRPLTPRSKRVKSDAPTTQSTIGAAAEFAAPITPRTSTKVTPGKKRGRPRKQVMISLGNGEEVAEQGDWTFRCACGVQGQNLNDGKPMVACERCDIWQHIACINRADRQAGRPKRDWDHEDFVCQSCCQKRRATPTLDSSATQALPTEPPMEAPHIATPVNEPSSPVAQATQDIPSPTYRSHQPCSTLGLSTPPASAQSPVAAVLADAMDNKLLSTDSHMENGVIPPSPTHPPTPR